MWAAESLSRLIPAHAGKTPLRHLSTKDLRAHPRSRGENRTSRLTGSGGMGSSPLTRGKPSDRETDRPRARLIPAHAGKTTPRWSNLSSRSAHPRSRGENSTPKKLPSKLPGSSPLTRGKLSGLGINVAQLRLIPAHAGKTSAMWAIVSSQAAHPRSRGENAANSLQSSLVAGSSPLTRGKHFLTCAFTAQIDQILETLELAASSGSYSIWVACATDAPQDQVQSIGLVLPSSRGAS